MALQPIIRSRERPAAAAGKTAAVRPAAGESRKRYCIILRIRHRDLNPDEITSTLGWQPNVSWRAGEQSVTPTGRPLASVRTDGLWSRQFEWGTDQAISDSLNEVLQHLARHEQLFHRLDDISAQTALYLQLPGSLNIGDHIGCETLGKFANLRIALEIEVFPDWK